MRFLYVIHTARDPQTAVFRTASGVIDALKSRGHEGALLSPDDLPSLRYLPPRLLPLTYPVAAARWIARQPQTFDMIVFHSHAGWAYHLLRLRNRVRPVVVTKFHGLEPLYFQGLDRALRDSRQDVSWRFRLFRSTLLMPLLRYTSRQSHGLVCLTSAERAYLLEHAWSTPSRVRAIPNPVPDLAMTSRSRHRNTRRILSLGHWLPIKGNHVLARAFERLAERYPDLTLRCAGTLRPERDVLSDFPSALRSRVEVVPRFDRATISALLEDSDVFVFLSYFEGWGNALLEAAAAGLPIVTTPVGAGLEVMRPDQHAVFVPVGDIAATVDAIHRLLADDALRERLGNAARDLVDQLRDSQCEISLSDYLETLAEPDSSAHSPAADA